MTTAPAFTTEQIKDFVRQHRLTESEIQAYFHNARNPGYWQSICSSVTVGCPKRPFRTHALVTSHDGIAETAQEYRERGYIMQQEMFDISEVDCLKDAAFAVQKSGWPMIFALVYDQFWSLLRSPRLVTLLNEILGPRYQLTVLFWVHYVRPIKGAAGFPPHKDGGCGYPTLSCWIPLTPATVDNGCMYVIERSPVTDEIAASFGKFESFSQKQMRSLLGQTQALPVVPSE